MSFESTASGNRLGNAKNSEILNGAEALQQKMSETFSQTQKFGSCSSHS